LSYKNQFYTDAPPHGVKIRRGELDITVDRVVVVSSVYVERYRHSRWIAVAFHFGGRRVWTNVVRDPIACRAWKFATHYTNQHTQWGYRVMDTSQSQTH
jgi:hypothetical protein